MKTIICVTLLFSLTTIGQNFRQVGPNVYLDEGEVSQTELQSYIYLQNINDYDVIKNHIYSFFDNMVNQNPENYNPALDKTTSYMFIVYKKTTVLNENFIFNENANVEKNPLIDGHNVDILATVNYSISSNQIKSIFFYENKILVKRFLKNEEKPLTNAMKDRFKIDNMF